MVLLLAVSRFCVLCLGIPLTGLWMVVGGLSLSECLLRNQTHVPMVCGVSFLNWF